MALSVFKNGVINTNFAKLSWLSGANNEGISKRSLKYHKVDRYWPFSQSCYKIILYYDLQKHFDKNKRYRRCFFKKYLFYKSEITFKNEF